MKRFSGQSPESLQKTNEISLYTDPLTDEGILRGIKRIKTSFPQLTTGFYQILTEMLKEDKFTDARFHDSINNVIRTCIYPQPTIAQFLSWDKKRRIYNYHECVKIVTDANAKISDRFIKSETGFIAK